jgi:hypothetical protein
MTWIVITHLFRRKFPFRISRCKSDARENAGSCGENMIWTPYENDQGLAVELAQPDVWHLKGHIRGRRSPANFGIWRLGLW